MEEPAHNPGHQPDRDKYRHQGNAHRKNGETDLPGTEQCGVVRLQSGFDMTHHVFDYHDGIIDDKAGRDGERHERKIVKGIARDIKNREGAHDRDGNRNARNQCGPDLA